MLRLVPCAIVVALAVFFALGSVAWTHDGDAGRAAICAVVAAVLAGLAVVLAGA